MRIELSDLFCQRCRSYVHPFLEQCPACGAIRTSRYDEAVEDREEDRSGLASQPETVNAAVSALRRHSLVLSRGGFIGGAGNEANVDLDEESGVEAAEVFTRIARSIGYRAVGAMADPKAAAAVSLAVGGPDLKLEDPRRKQALRTVALASILGVTPVPKGQPPLPSWTGVVFGDLRAMPRPTVEPGDLLVTYADRGTFRQIGIGNRPGLLASKGRPDFYLDLVRWLGVAAAVAAEVRWIEVGAPAYAAELGVGPSAPRRAASAGEAIEADAAQDVALSTRPGAPAIRAALQELESLHATNLVSDEEYRRKRDEILARL